MATEIKIHPIQAKTLVSLLFKPGARFSDLLRETSLTSDHFTFHLNKLIGLGLIKKLENNKYQLTVKGKEFANRFDTERKIVERQAKIGVLIVGVKGNGAVEKYLVHQRLKEPYFGFHGFVTGKVGWGETVFETANRELKEETGLSGKITFKGIEHKMDYSEKGELLEDKYFMVFKAENLKGKLTKNFKGGKNIWLTKKELFSLPNLFKDIVKILEVIESKSFSFFENKFEEKIY